MTTLVTGFEPFAGSPVNSSELVARALAVPGEPGLVTAVLPTSYRRGEQALGDLVRLHRPRRLLMLGLAAGSSRMILEQVARNRDDCAAPDNDGEIRSHQSILAEAPGTYPSNLPLDRMAQAARRLGEEVFFSRDAGGYVCNHLFFAAAHLLATEFPASQCGFVHLPPLQEADERLARIVAVLHGWIGASFWTSSAHKRHSSEGRHGR